METLLPASLVCLLLILLFSGYPVALVLIGVSMAYTGLALYLDLMHLQMLSIFPARMMGIFAENLLLPAVAPFLFMGIALERSGIAKDLFLSVAYLLRRLPGNMTLAVLFMGVILAPAAGLIGASVAMLSLAAIPSMLALNVDKRQATASVAVAGTIGTIIPPGIMLFFLADMLDTTIVGTFGGVLYPVGLLLAGYCIYFVAKGALGGSSQVITKEMMTEGSRAIFTTIVQKLILPVFLIIMVLGAIISGWATPTQAASVGAGGAFLLMAINRSLSWKNLGHVLLETGYTTAMVFFVIIAANAFSFVFRILGGDQLIPDLLTWLQVGDWGSLFFILFVIFVLGFFIDWIEIVVITLPIFLPVIANLDFSGHVGDPLMTRIWIAVLVAVVLQTSFLTPPFGFALFFLRGTTPKEIRMADIYKGILPLVAIQIIMVIVLLAYPILSTSIPAGILK